MPDIFISKNRQEKIDQNRTERIKKLLEKEKQPEAVQPSDKAKISASAAKQEIIRSLKAHPHGEVQAKIQSEINHILKNKPKNGFLSTFLGWPPSVRFETQDREEKIVALLRQHWIVNVPWIIAAVIMLVAAFWYKYLPLVSLLPSNYRLIIVLGYLLLVYYYVTEKLLKWFFNVYIITDERIVDVDFISLLYKQVSDIKIDKIQDITYDMSGLIEAFFNYGTIHIQTASEVPCIDFESIPRPQQVVRLINQLLLEEELEEYQGRVR